MKARRAIFYQVARIAINTQAWAQLLAHYTDKLGVDAAQRFMDANFIKAKPVLLRDYITKP